MSFPKYFVTYSMMDPDAGANIFGHACLILSIQADANDPIKISNSFGFYSQLNSTTNQFLLAIKYLLNIKMDLQEGHGVLHPEKMYELDGNGLYGKTYEVNKVQFDTLVALYTEETNAQQVAIDELNAALKKSNKKCNGHTRYVLEKELVEKESRNSRLYPFQLEMTFNWFGFDGSSSYTCKNRALDLLERASIIEQQERTNLDGGRVFRPFPRFSGEALPSIRLVSTGDTTRYETKSRKVFYNRSMDKNALFFASPMNQELDKTVQKSYQMIKNVLTEIRQVEHQLLSAIEHTQHEVSKHNLTLQADRMKRLYEQFRNSSENNLYNNQLPLKLYQAQHSVNIAHMMLNTKNIDSYFALRLLSSSFIHHALLGLLALLLIAPLIPNLMGAVLFSSSVCYIIYNLYGFSQGEKQLFERRESYQTFLGNKQFPFHIADNSRIPVNQQSFSSA